MLQKLIKIIPKVKKINKLIIFYILNINIKLIINYLNKPIPKTNIS